MKTFLCSLAALGTALVVTTTAIPTADAGPREYRGKQHSYSGQHRSYRGQHRYSGRSHHRGRGYWRNGRWIALGIGAAIAAGAAGAYDRDCYWRDGYRYCD